MLDQLADAGRRNPRDFNSALAATPPQPGVTPQNFQSLWAWDATQSRWYFYAPSLDAQGGSAMADYIAGRGLLDFSAAGRVLDPASGFWVLKP